MPRNDPQYVVGARVQAKAHHVTALGECHQRFGANAKTKFVIGTVVSVDVSSSSGGRRATTLITADYELGGGTMKRCQLNSRDQDGRRESTTGESNEPVTALMNENVERVNETIDVGAPSVAHLTTQGLLDELRSLSDEDPEEEGTPATAAARAIAPHSADIDGPRSVVATVHYVEWRRASSSEPVLNGNHTPRVWSVRNALGENLYPGRSISEINGMSALIFFLLMFPPKQLVLMVDLTNDELAKLDVKLTNTSELLKFFGVLIQPWPPTYVAIDRKPENGCKIQNAACGRSEVMLRLKFVKGVDLVGEEDNADEPNNESSLLHGTQLLKHVVSPWFGPNCIVCADSYFASIGAAKELYRIGLRFNGVVKTATRGFPKTFLTSVELNERGDFLALASDSVDELDPTMAVFVWMDRERRYFIATAGALSEGTPYSRCRWRQVSQDPHAPPERVTLTIKQPQIAEIYYSTTCGAIDKHNRYRQDDLRIEKKIETKDWSVVLTFLFLP